MSKPLTGKRKFRNRRLTLSDEEFAEELENAEFEDTIPDTIMQDIDDWDQEDWEFLIRRNDYK